MLNMLQQLQFLLFSTVYFFKFQPIFSIRPADDNRKKYIIVAQCVKVGVNCDCICENTEHF